MLRVREILQTTLEQPFIAIAALGMGIMALAGGAEVLDITLQTDALPDKIAAVGMVGGLALAGVGAVGINRPQQH